MSKAQRKQQQQRSALAHRPSDGNLADPITIGPDKSINIDLAKLPPPTNIYDADFAWVEHTPGKSTLFFAKRSRDEENQLRTRLEIRYPAENLVRQFWKNSRTFHDKLEQFTSKWPKDESREHMEPMKMKAQKEHSEWANFEAMAFAGTEACIDFYRLPPAGIAMFARGQGSSGLRSNPVVRVQLTVFELLRLLDATRSVVLEIEKYLPKAVVEAEPGVADNEGGRL